MKSFKASLACSVVVAVAALGPQIATADTASHSRYKHDVASRVMTVNKAKISKAAYRTISVVGYTIDRTGKLVESWIVRSSGDHALDQRALVSFQKAAPLPQPPATLFGVEPTAHLSEAFVFLADGTYKLQSLSR